jgi:2-polyprenyl-6-methoxyphenol hydroxylase-like FAD-dependent oxidoreductase
MWFHSWKKRAAWQVCDSSTTTALRERFARRSSWEQTGGSRDWKQIAVLSVESGRVKTWFRPGLLLIGDAAHVMSPVGGVGINYAIQDAVEAANLLAAPLAAGTVTLKNLKSVQAARELPVKTIQFFQKLIQNAIIGGVLTSKEDPGLPLPLRVLTRIAFLRRLPARLVAFGIRKVRVR